MATRYKFPNIPNLDNQLELIIKNITELTGKRVDKLPPISGVKEFEKFFIKNSSNNYDEYMKIGDKYHKQAVTWEAV